MYMGALTLFAGQADAPAMRIAYVFYIIQSQAEALDGMYVARRNAVKFVEYLVKVLFGNTDPAIGNRNAA